MKTERCDLSRPDASTELRAMLAELSRLPYHYLPQVPIAARVRLVAARLADVTANGGVVLVAREQGALVGVAALRPLAFDTELFGLAIARLALLEALGDYARQHAVKQALVESLIREAPEIESIHSKIDFADLAGIHVLEALGFFSTAGWVDYGLCPDRWEPGRGKPPCFVRHARREDAPLLEQLSGTAFTLDRFHADPALSPIRSDQLHRHWIRNSLLHGLAQCVLVAENGDGEPVGFITYNVHDEDPDLLGGVRIANVMLNATREDFRGRGVYTQLLAECILDCQGRVDFLHVESQANNFAVQCVWANLGLRLVDAGLSLHWHRAAQRGAFDTPPAPGKEPLPNA